MKLFINARTDVYLAEIGSPETRVGETIERAARYREAGANGIFVPGLSEPTDIQAIASEIKMPLNVMAIPDLPDVKGLKKRCSPPKLRHRHSAIGMEPCCRIGERVPRNWRPKANVQKLYVLR